MHSPHFSGEKWNISQSLQLFCKSKHQGNIHTIRVNIVDKYNGLYLASIDSNITEFNRNLCSWSNPELGAKHYVVQLKALHCLSKEITLPSKRLKQTLDSDRSTPSTLLPDQHNSKNPGKETSFSVYKIPQYVYPGEDKGPQSKARVLCDCVLTSHCVPRVGM